MPSANGAVGAPRRASPVVASSRHWSAWVGSAEAGAGAVEAVRNAVVLPTPGIEAWWRAVVGETVYALRGKGLVQYVWETVDWTVLLKKLGGLQLLQRLDPPLTPPVESKAKPFTRL